MKDNEIKFYKACEVAIEAGKASTALIQRRLQIPYSEAAEIMTQLESRNIIRKNHDRPADLLVKDINECKWTT